MTRTCLPDDDGGLVDLLWKSWNTYSKSSETTDITRQIQIAVGDFGADYRRSSSLKLIVNGSDERGL